jgi:hypothetical protein
MSAPKLPSVLLSLAMVALNWLSVDCNVSMVLLQFPAWIISL